MDDAGRERERELRDDRAALSSRMALRRERLFCERANGLATGHEEVVKLPNQHERERRFSVGSLFEGASPTLVERFSTAAQDNIVDGLCPSHTPNSTADTRIGACGGVPTSCARRASRSRQVRPLACTRPVPSRARTAGGGDGERLTA